MKISRITTIEAVTAIKKEWNDLLEQSIFKSPFLRNEYQTAWWQHQGGGEWQMAQLNVLVAYDDNDSLVGIAPFYITSENDGTQALRLIGGIEISDYLDVIVSSQNATQFWQLLFETINSSDFPEWDVLQIYNMSEDSPSVLLLETVAFTEKYHFHKEIYQPCPQIILPNTWEDYLNSLNSKFKKNLTRRMRMADNHYVPVTWEFVQPDEFKAQLKMFFELMAQDPDKNKFLTPQMKIQMELNIRTAYQHEMMQFAILKLDQKMIASLMYFEFDNKLWGYNSALDLNHLELSPGLVLKGKHIQWAIEKGYKIYDFMRGNESYKYDFGAKDTHVLKIEISC